MGHLPDTHNCGLRMHRECRERFPRRRLQRKLLVSDPSMLHGTCVTHVPWCMSGSLTHGGRGKHSRHSRRMHNPQFCISGKRPRVLLPPWPMNIQLSLFPQYHNNVFIASTGWQYIPGNMHAAVLWFALLWFCNGLLVHRYDITTPMLQSLTNWPLEDFNLILVI